MWKALDHSKYIVKSIDLMNITLLFRKTFPVINSFAFYKAMGTSVSIFNPM